jgi:hypothetical protein
LPDCDRSEPELRSRRAIRVLPEFCLVPRLFCTLHVFFVAIVLFYGIIAIHDIPYEIAKSRQHPQ